MVVPLTVDTSVIMRIHVSSKSQTKHLYKTTFMYTFGMIYNMGFHYGVITIETSIVYCMVGNICVVRK